MNTAPATAFITSYIKESTPILEKYFDDKLKEATEFPPAIRFTIERLKELGLKGKKFRGALVTLGYMLAGGRDHQAILETSIFAEIFHEGLLVHDDIMDHAETRRGLPAIHTALGELSKSGNASDYGIAMAICGGDLLFNFAWSILATSSFDTKEKMRAIECFSTYFTRVGYGQMMDVGASQSKDITEEEVMDILRIKTGEYSCVLPLCVGALLAGCNDEYINALTQYALHLGWAFQIQDDILGTFGKEEETGKPNDSDIREGKQTLLILHLRKHAAPDQQATLDKTLGNITATESDIEQLRSLLKTSGSYDYVIGEGKRHIEEGKKIVERLTKDATLQILLASLLDLMMERKS